MKNLLKLNVFPRGNSMLKFNNKKQTDMLNVFKERKAFLNIVLVLDNFEQIQPTNPVFFLLTLNKNLLVTCLSYTYSIKKFPHVFTK